MAGDKQKAGSAFHCIPAFLVSLASAALPLICGKELFGHVIKDADDFGNMFLKYGKVAVVPGTGFGAPNFVRWSYATSMENIKEGLDRLERFLAGETI